MSLSTQTGLAGITAVLPSVLPVPWGWLVPSHHTRCTHHPISQATGMHSGPCTSAFVPWRSPGCTFSLLAYIAASSQKQKCLTVVSKKR